MGVRKFCECGVKLERDVANEAAAYEVVSRFWLEHSGAGHGPVSYKRYVAIVSRIVARNATTNRPRQVKPLLSAISKAEASTFDGRQHKWEDGPGIIFCSVCLILNQANGNHSQCAGASLMKPSEFIGYPLPWFKCA